MLNGLDSRFRSFKLGGTIGSCCPNPYGIVGSFQSSWIVKIWCSGHAIEETEGIRAVWVCDISVEFRMFGELFRCGLDSLDICSTKNTSDSSELIEVLNDLSTLINKIEKISRSSNWIQKMKMREWSVLRLLMVHFHEAGFPLMFPRRCSASMKVGSKNCSSSWWDVKKPQKWSL